VAYAHCQPGLQAARQGVLLILLTLANAVMNLQQERKAAASVAALSRAGATTPTPVRCLTGPASSACLGLHAPGGNRVGQRRVVAFGLVGIGLGEVGHGLVELA